MTNALTTSAFANTRSHRNMIINGGMDVWQRGTSFASVTNAQTFADRWRYAKVGTPTAVHSVSQSTDIPTVAQSGTLFNYSLLATVTTAQASPAAGDFIGFYQGIEGYNFKNLAQRPMVLSFWVKSSVTGTYSIAFRNSVRDQSYVTTYTVNSANTWEYKTVTVSASPTTGTWNYLNGAGLYILFTLMSGTTAQTSTLNAWQSSTPSTVVVANTQVNAVSTLSATWQITGLQVEQGYTPTPFEVQPFDQIVSACQRYFEKSYTLTTAPGTGTSVGQYINVRFAPTASFAGALTQYNFVVKKRTTPTFTVYATASGTINSVRRGDNTDQTGFNVAATDVNFGVYNTTALTYNTVANSASSLDFFAFQWTADCEL